MSHETITNVLRSMGLTEKETEVYIFLARHGVLRSGEIVRGVKTHRTEVYRILKGLQNKGLIMATLEAPTRFKASPFETVLDSFIKAKREEATRIEVTKRDLLSDWEDIRRRLPEPEVETFVVIEGRRKIYSKILQMLKETNNGIVALLPFPDLLRAENLGFFDGPPKSTIQARLLIDLSDAKLSAVKTLRKKLEKFGFTIRAKNPEIGLQLSPSMVIRDNKEILFFITPRTDSFSPKDDVCLWTNCKELVNSFAVVFEDLWRNSEEMENKILEIKRGPQNLKSCLINDEQAAKKKYNEAIDSAKEEIFVVTSSEGLTKLSENRKTLKEIAGRGVSIKILAPIIGKNLKAAMTLSEYCGVRHAPSGWLATTVIDSQHLFQFKIPSAMQQSEAGHFESVFYTGEVAYVGTTRKMLFTLWKNSRPPSNVSLDRIIENTTSDADPYKGKLLSKVIDEKPPGALTEKDILDKIFTGKRFLAPRGFNDIVRYYGSSAMGIVYPPTHFNLPDILFNVVHCNKQSSFGGEDWILISLRLETTDGTKYVPVVHVTDNPRAARARKRLFAGTPTSARIQIVREHELQVHVQGNSLFAGWTMPIPLPILNNTIPPAGLLFEGYGDVKSGAIARLSQNGRRQETEYNRMEAFLTFFHPASKYSGPGIDGFFDREMVFTSYPPASK